MFRAAVETDFPSGPWTGFYQRTGRRFAQEMELSFDGGVIRGAGWDNVGEFVIKGCYDLDTREVRWTKKYAGRNVYYRGFREGKGIWGTWREPGKPRAGFHVWPLGADDDAAKKARRAAGNKKA
ncbi:MAG: hypothetical protein AB7O97_03840 [Planctomycetota bacterium]